MPDPVVTPGDRTSPNALYLGDRVRVSAHHDTNTTGGMSGIVRGFDGPWVLVQPDGFASALRFRYEDVR